MSDEMDEYQLEIQDIRRQLARLKADKADEALIQEYEVELRNLVALYQAATHTLEVGVTRPALRRALTELGFGDWTLENVYSFVYDAAMDADTEGRALAAVINDTDYARSLLAAAEEGAGA